MFLPVTGWLWRVAAPGAAVVALVVCPSAFGSSVYVVNQTAAKVSQYTVGPDGTIPAGATPTVVATGTSPQAIALSPDGKSAYVANGSANTVSQYTVAADGTLSAKTPATVATGTNPSGVTLGADGKSAYVVNFRGNSVSQFTVAADGTLSAKSPATVPTGTAPFGLALSPDGRSAYVANRNSGSVSQYTVASDGSLSPKTPATVAAGSQPAKVAVSADGKSAYVANGAAAGTVSQYTVGADGTLSPKSPATAAAGNQPAGIALTADGTAAFVANGHGNNVSQFTIAAGGTLSPSSPATVGTGASPGPLVLSADGASAYVPNFTDSTVSQYAVSGGILSAKTPATVTTGAGPNAIAVTPSPPALAAPSLSTQASAASVALGGQISASATLAAGSAPTGTITFNLYGPGDPNCATSLGTSAAAVSGNGTYASAAFTPSSPGSYVWTALYGGDGANQSAGPTSCASPGASVTVTASTPTVAAGGASGVTASAATVTGTVTPNGASTAYVFEYGPSLSFGSITAPADAGSGPAANPVSGSLSGLSPGTTYYFRLVASNSQGTAFGPVGSFVTTAPVTAPVAVTLAPQSVSDGSAVLAGQVNPGGQATAYTFEYGTTTSFGSITPVVELDSAQAPEPVSSLAGGLASNTTYLYRVVATNAAATTVGGVMSFTTGPGAAPVVSTGAASAITSTGAILTGAVDPQARSTTFTFEYGTTTSFGSVTAIDSAGQTAGPETVALPVTGLASNTTYLYRIVATNADGTSAGAVNSLTTVP